MSSGVSAEDTLKPVAFVKVMNALGMDDFTVIENLWNMIEQDMEVSQKNLLRTLFTQPKVPKRLYHIVVG